MLGREISVLIVEDHSVVRWAVRSFLEHHGVKIIGETASAAEAVDLAAREEPDVVLMDLATEDAGAIEATRAINRARSGRVLAFCSHGSPDQIDVFLRAGGSGFISKSSPIEDLLAALNAVADDREWIPADAISQSSLRGKHKSVLSDREREVAVLVSKGFPSSQIAARLFVSINTVETHRYRIFKKLDIHSRAELVDYVLKHNLMGDWSAEGGR